jgi:hypothetical protein
LGWRWKTAAALHQLAHPVDQGQQIQRYRREHIFTHKLRSIVALAMLINRLPFFCFRLNIEPKVDQAVGCVYKRAKSKLRDGVQDEKM